jgi:hypothetical protein
MVTQYILHCTKVYGEALDSIKKIYRLKIVM